MQKAAADLLANRQKRPVGVQHPDRPGSRGCGRGAIRVAEVFSRQRVAVGGPPGATLVDDDLREPGEQAFDGHQPRQRCRDSASGVKINPLWASFTLRPPTAAGM